MTLIIIFADPRSLIPLPTGDYDNHHTHLNYIIQLIRLGSEFRDVANDTVDLPSSIPNQKGEEYVYVYSPPEDSSNFLTQDVHMTGTKATSLERSTASTRSTNRQGQGDRTSDKNNGNKLLRSFRKTKSKSPQPEDSISSTCIPPNQRPSSPYLLDYSTNRGNSLGVSLDTFPSTTPQQGEEDYAHSSATKRLLSLFQWRKKKERSYSDRFSTPPPEVCVQGADEHREQLQILSQSFGRHQSQSQSREFGTSSYNGEHRVGRPYRPSTFSGVDRSFAVSSTGTIVGGLNVVTVEVEVHNVDESLELNSESPAQKTLHPSISSNSYSINKSTESAYSTDGEFLSLPEGAAPSSKKSHHNRRRILSFGTARDAIQKKLQHQRHPKSHTEVHNRSHHLKVPLLDDHREEYSSCSDSDETGDRLSRSRSSSVRTSESSFIVEDGQESTTAATTTAAKEVDYMSDEFASKLEWNFKKDHLLREACTDLKEAVSDTVKQGQVSVHVHVQYM